MLAPRPPCLVRAVPPVPHAQTLPVWLLAARRRRACLWVQVLTRSGSRVASPRCDRVRRRVRRLSGQQVQGAGRCTMPTAVCHVPGVCPQLTPATPALPLALPADLVELTRQLSSLPGVKAVGLTSNGLTLGRKLAALKHAGARDVLRSAAIKAPLSGPCCALLSPTRFPLLLPYPHHARRLQACPCSTSAWTLCSRSGSWP